MTILTTYLWEIQFRYSVNFWSLNDYVIIRFTTSEKLQSLEMQNPGQNYNNKKETLLYKSLTEVRILTSESFNYS